MSFGLIIERAKKVIPCGANTYSKSHNYFTRPIILDHGKGAYVWDTEGKAYLDMMAALGPVTIGYCDQRVDSAVRKQLGKGISFPTVTELEIELSEKLTQIIPGVEMVRLLKNGSDATSAAIRLARTYSGKDLVLKCGYHGMDDWTIGAESNSRGIPQAIKDMTIKFKYNDLESIEHLLNSYQGHVACVILEPIQDDGPLPGYLSKLKGLCDRHNCILIFDEVVSGARYALGGAAEFYRVIPDLVCAGKGIANGMPISFVGGRRDIMQTIESGAAFISTTFGGETLSIAAALATIEILEQPGTFEHMWFLGKLASDGLKDLRQKYQLEEVINIVGLPPRCGVTFNDHNGLDYLDYASIWNEVMLDNGILTHGINYYMLSMSEADINHYLNASDKAMEKIKLAAEKGATEGILLGNKLSPIFRRF